MGKLVITLKIMPEGPESDLADIRRHADVLIEEFAGHPSDKQEIEPVGFGIKALKLIFLADEAKGGTENLEKSIAKVHGVNSVEVVGLDRTF